MKRIYLDHNILQYFVRGFPQDTSKDHEEEQLEKLLKDKGYRFCLSVWNFIEIPNRSQEVSAQYAKLIEKLNPEWLSDRLYIEKAEVKNFVFSQLLGQKIESSDIAWNSVFSQMMVTINGMGDKAVIGETPRQFLRLLCDKPEFIEKLRDYPGKHPQMLKELQAAYQDKKKWKEMAPVVFRNWLQGMLPEKMPDGRQAKAEERASWLDACLKQESKLLSACPALSAENCIMDFRVGDAGREPQASDAIDLQHAVPVVGYGDIFVSADGFLRGAVNYCSKKLGRDIKVCKRLSEV